MVNKMYSVNDIKSYFGCSREKSYQIIHSVGFPKIKIGKQYYIPVDKFDKWIENHINLTVRL